MPEQEKAETSKTSEEAKGRKPSDQKSTDQMQKTNAQSDQSDGETEQDAITLLKNDHRAVEALFTQFENASRRAEKITLARQVCQDLIIHTLIEEEIFYPACREHVDDDMLDEAQVEHDSAKTLINELISGSPENDGFFDAKVKVLSELIKHHVEEEEKRAEGIFAKAKAGGLDIDELGRKLAARKQELKQQAERQSLGRPRPRSFRAFQQSNKEDYMPQSTYRERDRQGRFVSDDDDDRSYSSRGRNSDRDDYGRYARDDDGDRRSSRGGRAPDRDDQGRFVGDEDDRGSSRSSRGSYSRSRDDEDDRNYSRSSRSSYGRSRDDDDDRRYSSAGRNRGQGSGWYGDSEGHSEASRRGWQNSDHDGSGWYGDSRGHSEASRRGWENRDGSRGRSRYDDDDRSDRSSSSRSAYSRSRDDDDDDDRRGGRSGGGRGSDRGQGGWFGDSEGHSEASRRGWENRR